MPLPHERRVLLDLDVRRDAVVLHVPFAVRAVEGPPRRGHLPPSMSARIVADADEPPQVRMPTSGPISAFLNSHGSASPPEPDIWFAIITFGP